MLLSIESFAAINVILAVVSAILCGFFVSRLWVAMLEQGDVGSVGFCLIFTAVLLFNLWDITTYTIIALPGPEPQFIWDLTILKPIIHGLEIIAYLLLYLHFRKSKDERHQG